MYISGFFNPSKDFYRTRGSMFLLFFKSTFRWTTPASFTSPRVGYDTSVTRGPLNNLNFFGKTMDPSSGQLVRSTLSTGPPGKPDCFDYNNRRAQLTSLVKTLDSTFIPSTLCQTVPPGFSLV